MKGTGQLHARPILVLGGTGKILGGTGKTSRRVNARLADGVQRALGRQPRDFADYAGEAAASGVWHASPAIA